MRGAQHTRRPWINTGPGENVEADEICIDSLSGARVAMVYPMGDDEAGLAEQAANACLIIAAPDLLEACEVLLDAQSRRRHPLGAPDEGIAGLCAEAASKARAAIAKARGEVSDAR